MKKYFMPLLFLLFISPTVAKDLTIVVPVEADSHTVNARIFSKYLSKHLPDKPTITFKVVPGAASVVAANYLYNIAPKDGNTIGVFFKNIPLISKIGGPNIDFDATKFTWLGSTADGRKDAVLLLSTKQLKDKLIIGSANVVAGDPIEFLQKTTNFDIKVVKGYKGPANVRHALEQNEVDSMINSLIGIKTSNPYWLEPNSKIKAILQFGNGNKRHPEFLNIPTLYEIIDEKYKSELQFFESQFILIRPYVAPPSIPKEKAAELRKAFSAAVTDPEYIKEANSKNIEVSPIMWEEIYKIL